MATDIEKLLEEIWSLPPEEQRRVRELLDRETFREPDGKGHQAEEQFQRRLVQAGLLTQIKRPRRDAEAFQNRKLAEIQGKPLSEIIIEERR